MVDFESPVICIADARDMSGIDGVDGMAAVDVLERQGWCPQLER
jgi:hypothetical protein